MAALLDQAIAAQRAGDVAAAADLYTQVLATDPDNIDALTLLGPLRLAAGQRHESLALLERATLLAPTHALAWYNLGLAHGETNDRPALAKAQAALLRAVNLAPQQSAFWLALARLFVRTGDVTKALPILDQLQTQAQTPELLILRAQILADRDLPQARKLAQDAADIAHATGDAGALTLALLDRNRYDHLARDPQAQLDGAYLHLSLTTNNALPWLQLARIHLAHSQYQLAIAMLDQAVRIDSRSLEIQWLRAFANALPIYGSQSQIVRFLRQYEAALEDLSRHIDTLTDAELVGAELLPDLLQALFLAYNGEDICRAQSLAGDIYHKVLTRRLGAPLLPDATARAARPDKRIVLAIVSETFYYHSNMKLRRGWLRRIDRNKFKLCLYHIGDKTDGYTDEIRALCDEFHHIPHNFDATLARLRADAPDIIQYTNLGLHTLTLKLAALRIAPVQVNTWGHPITSGSPMIDYFISNELMETPEAQDYYREELVRLPGLSIVPETIFDPEKRLGPINPRTRADFGLAPEDTLYLCLQSVQKYLPKHDYIYAAIAAEVPDAKFLFIEHADYAAVADLFKTRLRGPFLARGLDPDRHLVFLPFQNQEGYSALHRLADITLDSLEWSGANTTFEALELGGLVMTTPGRFMRGRHTAAILHYIGMDELVLPDEASYIEFAIALGRDPVLRNVLRQKLQHALPSLYRDPGIGPALNGFYESAYRRWAAAN